MINYSKPNITTKDIKIVKKVLQSGFLTQGDYVKKFEKKLCSYFGAKYACTLSNGTMGLYILGKALNWCQKDLIITTPNTFLATANCITYNNANIKFIDINPKTFCIDIDQLKQFLLKNKQKVSAIIGVDFAGNTCDWRELRQLQKKYKFLLINDNCHALGSFYFKSKKYALKYADFIVHSYHGIKNFTTGEGGAILTNDKNIYQKVKNLTNHGVINKYTSRPWERTMINLGYNLRLSDISCALGISQLDNLDNNNNKRRLIAKNYINNLSFSDKIRFQQIAKNCTSSYHLFPISFDFNKIQITKKDLYNFFYKNNIKLQSHYPPIHLNDYYRKKFNFKKGDFPNAENYYNNSFSFPCYPKLNQKEFDLVISCIKKIIL